MAHNLEINNLTFTRQGFSLSCSATIPVGAFVGILGPSGSGKTTLLNLIAGILSPSGGSIVLDGTPLHSLPLESRRVGLVFQDYALFEHMTVAQNIAYPLRYGVPGKNRPNDYHGRVGDLIKLCHLEGLGDRRPPALSGGQQQRVAIARALASDPQILLLDEPLSALDPGLRNELLDQTADIQRRTGITTLYVTHDQEEALGWSDTILVLNKGQLVAKGPPRELFGSPPNLWCASFLGWDHSIGVSRVPGAPRSVTSPWGNLFPGSESEVESVSEVECGCRCESEVESVSELDLTIGDPVLVFHGAELDLHFEQPGALSRAIMATVEGLRYLGQTSELTLRMQWSPSGPALDTELRIRQSTHSLEGVSPGQTVWVDPPRRFKLFPPR